MTLLGRAPREVYRVYGEEEFLSDPGRDERFEATERTAPRLKRVVGATMLVAAIGAVGGIVAVTRVSAPGAGSRRVGAGLLAATGSLASSRAGRAIAGRATADGAAGRARVQGAGGRRAPTAHLVPRADVRRSRPLSGRRRPRGSVDAASPTATAAAVAPREPASAAEVYTDRRVEPSEFGFER